MSKELRNARKKLKGIEELEARDPSTLDADQRKKVEGKAAAAALVDSLQAKLTALQNPPPAAPAKPAGGGKKK